MSKEKLSDLDHMIRGQRGIKSKAQQIKSDDQFYEKQKAYLTKKIKLFTDQLNDLEYHRAHADEIIAEAIEREQELIQLKKQVEHRAEIERLLRLARQINEMESEEEEDDN